MTEPLRFGILGAARVTQEALIKPSQNVPDVEIAAIAARQRSRAEAQAQKFGIPTVHESYDALINDPHINAVYIPLPNSLHCQWSIRALQAGKHVLCEKPIANNADEAEQMAQVARQSGLVLGEAMHSRYHALQDRVRQILDSGVIGEIRHVETHACFIIANGKDIRWQYDLGGGAVMDLGVYAVAFMRFFADEEPRVTRSVAKVAQPNVDRWMDAAFEFPSGATGRVLCSMWGWPLLDGNTWVVGSEGRLSIANPYGPQLFNQITLQTKGSKTKESVPKLPTSYQCQLEAFKRSVQTGEPLRTGPDHFIANMKVIDAMYRAAGLTPRGVK